MLVRIFPDRFVPILLATIMLASLLPVRGAAVPVAQGLSTAAIVLLFFLNGVRLPRDEVLHGIRHWKLQGSALLFCFGIMALLGLGAQLATAPLLPAKLALGFLDLGILPSTMIGRRRHRQCRRQRRPHVDGTLAGDAGVAVRLALLARVSVWKRSRLPAVVHRPHPAAAFIAGRHVRRC